MNSEIKFEKSRRLKRGSDVFTNDGRVEIKYTKSGNHK
jgi:hypothetical protein